MKLGYIQRVAGFQDFHETKRCKRFLVKRPASVKRLPSSTVAILEHKTTIFFYSKRFWLKAFHQITNNDITTITS